MDYYVNDAIADDEERDVGHTIVAIDLKRSVVNRIRRTERARVVK